MVHEMLVTDGDTAPAWDVGLVSSGGVHSKHVVLFHEVCATGRLEIRVHDGVEALAHVFNRHQVGFGGLVIRGRTYVATFLSAYDGTNSHLFRLGQ